MIFDDAMEYINSFSHSGKKVKNLSRIQKLLAALKNPHKKLEFVHIAGTNGKGSVLEYSSNILIEAGYRVGQFTSPYVESYCDRIRVNNRNIPHNQVAKICERVKAAADNEEYSQFEITFAIALVYFIKEKCDIVFLETGIGGTLDATNIIESPLAAVITSVSLDHVAILGNTVEEIAAHKLGIIKKGCPAVISYDNCETVLRMAEKKAEEKNAVLILPDSVGLELIRSDITGSDFRYRGEQYRVRMCGDHQITNALTAIETVKLLRGRFNISQKNIASGLEKSKINLRIEVIGEDPLVIIDGGHNAAGVDCLIRVLERSGIKKAVGLFGMVYGKSADTIIRKISPFLVKVFCAEGYNENNIRAEELARQFRKNGVDAEECHVSIGCRMAYKYAQSVNLPLVINGSLYLTSEAKKELSAKIL